MDRLTQRREGYIIRVCHYPENQFADNSCLGCVDRTKCNADLFERLATYEDMIECGELIFENGNLDVIDKIKR